MAVRASLVDADGTLSCAMPPAKLARSFKRLRKNLIRADTQLKQFFDRPGVSRAQLDCQRRMNKSCYAQCSL